VGGGFAGLSSAICLADAGVAVTLFEQNRHLGGRARSFLHDPTGDTVDNGQHLLMRCYDETLEFLARIGMSHALTFQSSLQIPFLAPPGLRSSLICPSWLPGMAGIAWGLAQLPGVGLSDLLQLRKMTRDFHQQQAYGTTVSEFLDRYEQSSPIRKHFWTPLCLAALNLHPSQAPADHLVAVLRLAFSKGPKAVALGYPNVGLSNLFVEAAHRYLRERGGQICLGDAVSSIESGGRIRTRSGAEEASGACVVAVAPPALGRLVDSRHLGGAADAIARAQPSPIISVNLWFDRELAQLADTPFAGLLGTRMHWVFNKRLLYGGNDVASPGHVTVVTSAADALVGLSDEELRQMAVADLEICFGSDLPDLLHSLVVREHRATYAFPHAPPPRPGRLSPSLYLAGDWTDTGLPGTIESAVLSGRLAAEALLADQH